MADQRTERYPALEMAEANAECGVRFRQQYRVDCPECGKPVMLHCDNCKVQVTGCFCTERDRFGNDEALRRIIEREGSTEQVVERLKRSGFVLPPGME